MKWEGAGYPEAGSGLFREGQPLRESLSRRVRPSIAITMGGGRRKPVHVGLEAAPHGRIRSPWAWRESLSEVHVALAQGRPGNAQLTPSIHTVPRLVKQSTGATNGE